MRVNNEDSMTTLKRRRLGLTHNTAKSANGYTLYAPQTGNGKVILLDASGHVHHKWQMPVRPGRDAVLLPNGNLGYNGSHGTSANLYAPWDIWHGGHFMEATWDGDIVWEHEDIYHHHDAQWLEDGLIYTVAAEHNGKQSDIVKQVNRAGETVWEWRAWEHLSMQRYPIHQCFYDDHWPMINGVHKVDNLVYLSLRVCSGIIAVDMNTDEIVWELEYPNVAQQHCPTVNDGKLLAFCNGNIRPGVHHSRIVEYDLATKELAWSYVDDMPPSFFSPYMGSAQRLWNGNTFICESAFGRLFEVTPEGETCWEYVIPDFAEYPKPLNEFITGEQNSCFKAHRYKDLPQ